MARFTLTARDTKNCLVSLQKSVVNAIRWVDRHPQEFEIEVPDSLLVPPGGVPKKVNVNCLMAAVPAERALVETFLGTWKTMGARPGGAR